MAYGSHMENVSPRMFCILVSKRTRSCSVNISLVTYQISFIRSKSVMSIIPNFLPGFVQKMYMTKIKLFNVTSVNFRSILNVTILITEITDIFKAVMNPGIA